MKTEEEVKEKLKEIEEEVLQRLRDGHPQVRLIDSGKIEILNWVLQESGKLKAMILDNNPLEFSSYVKEHPETLRSLN